MSPLTKEDLAEVLDDVLNRRRAIEDEIHKKHHAFIQMEIDRRERARERWEKFQSSFIGGFALAILAFLGWLGTLILSWFQHSGGNPP